MTAVANSGGLLRPLPEGRNRPPPPWAYGAVGVAVLLHAAGAVWLYNQRFVMPAQPDRPEPPTSIIEIWNPPVVQPDPAPPAPSRPTPPIHRPITPPINPPVTSPFVPPESPTAAVAAGDPISLTPLPDPVVGGTAAEPRPPVTPSVIRNPDWVRRPSATQLERAFPERAINDGVSGQVTLNCVVAASGAVTGCSVTSESPQGYGFGRAGLSLTRYFEMRPRTVDGAPVEGARVSIPLVFSLGD